jgi:protein-S-isoprenylcysteine O-methyltransferase Ste14
MNPFKVLMHIPVPWVFMLAYLIGLCVELALRPHGFVDALPGAGIGGGVLLALGCLVAGWGLATFRKARTTTVPGRSSAQMVTWGPYRYSRNSMYVGLTLVYLGEAGLMRQTWPLAMLPLVLAYLQWTVIPVEEGKLIEVFGQDYDRYRANVRRWI